MNSRSTRSVLAPLWIILVVFVLGGVSLAVMRMESWTHQSGSFALDVSGQTRVDESLLTYDETASIALPIQDAHAFAVGDDGKLYVCGERTVSVLDRDGTLLRALSPLQKPRCVAVAASDHQTAGRVYVAAGSSIEVFSPSGESIATWNIAAKLPVLTAISLTTQYVYVADAGNQVVMQFDFGGNQTATIDNEFVVPSACFDLIAEDNGLLHVVNPGARRIETYSSEGTREAAWGRTGTAIEDFFGCCNPAYVAMLPGGQIVTSEKGIARIKVYDGEGHLQGVVADTVQLLKAPAPRLPTITDASMPSTELEDSGGFDIDTDDQGRILVLDSHANQIRIFTRKPPSTQTL